MEEKNKIIDFWLKTFDNFSHENQEAGKMLFYIFINQLTKNYSKIVFINNYAKIFPLHLIFLQESRSGKGKAINFFEMIINLFNELIIENKKLNFKELNGNEKKDILLNNDENKGILEKNNFLIYNEALFLLKNNKVIEMMLNILEEKPVFKREKDGTEIKTFFFGSLIATTRPLPNLETFMANSGMLQRCFCIIRELDDETRQKMNEKIIYLINRSEEEIKKQVFELIKELIKIFDFIKNINNNLSIKDEDECLLLMKNKNEELLEIIGRIQDKNHQKILASFVGGNNSIVMNIAIFNALSNFRTEIIKEDFIIATNFYKESFNHVKNWIIEKVKIDKAFSLKEKECKKEITDFLKNP